MSAILNVMKYYLLWSLTCGHCVFMFWYCICLELFKTLIPVYIKQYGWSCPNCAKDGTLGPVNFDGDSFAVSPAGPLASLVKTLSSYAQTSTAAKTQLCFCQQPKVCCGLNMFRIFASLHDFYLPVIAQTSRNLGNLQHGYSLYSIYIAMDKPEVLRCLAVPDYYSDKELAVVNDALKLCDVETVGLLRHSAAVATAFAHSQGGVDAAFAQTKEFQLFIAFPHFQSMKLLGRVRRLGLRGNTRMDSNHRIQSLFVNWIAHLGAHYPRYIFCSILAIPLLCLTGSSLLPDGTDERCVGFVDIGSSQGTVSVVKFFRKDWQRSCRDGRHGRVRVSEVGFTFPKEIAPFPCSANVCAYSCSCLKVSIYLLY